MGLDRYAQQGSSGGAQNRADTKLGKWFPAFFYVLAGELTVLQKEVRDTLCQVPVFYGTRESDSESSPVHLASFHHSVHYAGNAFHQTP